MSHSNPQLEHPKSNFLEGLILWGAAGMVVLVVLLFLLLRKPGESVMIAGPVDTNTLVLRVSDTRTDEDTAVEVRLGLVRLGGSVGEVAVTGASSNPELLPAEGILFGGTGLDRFVKLVPRRNQFGTSVVTVSVDKRGLASFRLTVDPVNDPPTLDAIASVVVSREPTLIPRDAVWRYLDDGSDQGTPWRETSFDDSDWKSGEAELGYGDDQRTKVSYGSNAGRKHVTTYFRRSFTVPDPSVYSAMKVGLVRDDGAVVYLNGKEVFRSGMPGGDVRYDTFAQGIAGNGEEGRFYFGDIDTGLLEAGVNVMAVELHQVSRSSSDIRFNLELEGEFGSSSEIKVELTGIGAGAENETELLSLSAKSSQPEVVAVGGQSYSSPDTTGELMLVPGRPGRAEVAVGVSDHDSTVTRVFTVYVNKPGNSLPTIAVDGEDPAFLGESIGPVTLRIGDEETAPDNLKLVARTSDPGLVPEEQIVFGGEGSERTVTMTPANGVSGTATITLEVVDEDFGMARRTFIWRISP